MKFIDIIEPEKSSLQTAAKQLYLFPESAIIQIKTVEDNQFSVLNTDQALYVRNV